MTRTMISLAATALIALSTTAPNYATTFTTAPQGEVVLKIYGGRNIDSHRVTAVAGQTLELSVQTDAIQPGGSPGTILVTSALVDGNGEVVADTETEFLREPSRDGIVFASWDILPESAGLTYLFQAFVVFENRVLEGNAIYLSIEPDRSIIDGSATVEPTADASVSSEPDPNDDGTTPPRDDTQFPPRR